MKRIFRILVMAAALCLALTGLALAGEITQYEARCVVDEAGRAQMTVTVQLSLPESVTAVQLPIGNGTRAAVAGADAKRVQLKGGNALELRADAGFSGTQTYVLTYTLDGVVTKTPQGQQLALELMAPGWQWPMAAASFSVTLPQDFSQKPAYVGGYRADTVEDVLAVTTENGVVSGRFTEPLQDHDTLRMTLALPADFFALHSADGVPGTVALAVVCALLVLAVFYWYRTLRSRRTRVSIRPLPPDGSAAGELPMLLTGADPRLALQIFQWASLGYLVLHCNQRGRIVLRRGIPMGSERRKQEQVVFESLFRGEAWCDGESLRFGRLSGRYSQAMRRYWNRRLFSKASGSPLVLRGIAALAAGMALLAAASAGLPQSAVRWLLLALSALVGAAMGLLVQASCAALLRRRFRGTIAGGVALVAALVLARLFGSLPSMVPALALQGFAAWATLRGGKRSPGGREKLAQALGFQRFLQHVSQHQLLALLREDSQYFYKMLPFAEAMGMGAAFAARFGEIEMEPCAFYETARPRRTPDGFYTEFRRTLTRLEAAARGK